MVGEAFGTASWLGVGLGTLGVPLSGSTPCPLGQKSQVLGTWLLGCWVCVWDVRLPVLAQGVLTRTSEPRVTRKECGFLPAWDMRGTIGQAANFFPFRVLGSLPLPPTRLPIPSLSHFLPVPGSQFPPF